MAVPTRISNAKVSEDGTVKITFRNGRSVQVAPEKGRTDREQLQVATSGSAVGWLAEDAPALIRFRQPHRLHHGQTTQTLRGWRSAAGLGIHRSPQTHPIFINPGPWAGNGPAYPGSPRYRDRPILNRWLEQSGTADPRPFRAFGTVNRNCDSSIRVSKDGPSRSWSVLPKR
jgi:hypothetical protein